MLPEHAFYLEIEAMNAFVMLSWTLLTTRLYIVSVAYYQSVYRLYLIPAFICYRSVYDLQENHEFTRKLMRRYDALRRAGNSFEIVLVSGNVNEEYYGNDLVPFLKTPNAI